MEHLSNPDRKMPCVALGPVSFCLCCCVCQNWPPQLRRCCCRCRTSGNSTANERDTSHQWNVSIATEPERPRAETHRETDCQSYFDLCYWFGCFSRRSDACCNQDVGRMGAQSKSRPVIGICTHDIDQTVSGASTETG